MARPLAIVQVWLMSGLKVEVPRRIVLQDQSQRSRDPKHEPLCTPESKNSENAGTLIP